MNRNPHIFPINCPSICHNLKKAEAFDQWTSHSITLSSSTVGAPCNHILFLKRSY